MSFGKFDPRILGVTSQAWQEDFAMKGMLEVSKELAKVKPESMRNFKEAIQGIGTIFGGPMAAARQGIQAPFRQLSAQIGFGIQSAFQPLTNQLSSFVNRINVATQPFIQRNIVGAGIGATAGAIIGSFIPGVGPTLGAILGGFVGAGIQEGITSDHPLAGGGGFVPTPPPSADRRTFGSQIPSSNYSIMWGSAIGYRNVMNPNDIFRRPSAAFLASIRRGLV